MSPKPTYTNNNETNYNTHFDQKWGYFYEALFNKIFRKNRYSLLFGYFLLIAIWLITAYFAERTYQLSSLILDWWWYCAANCIGLASAILFLSLAKKKMRDTYTHILELIPDKESQNKFMSTVTLMGDRQKQFILCGIFGLITFSIMLIQRTITLNSDTSNFLLLFIAIWSSVSALLAGVGLWLAITSIRMIQYLCSLTTLKLDFVNPAQTDGITKVSSLMGYYATLFALQVLTWEIPYVYTVWTSSTRILFLTNNWVQGNFPFVLASTIFALFLVVVLIYFIYPQLKIASLVDNYKRQTLSDIQLKINHIYTNNENLESSNISLLGYYLSLYKEIEEHKGSLPIQNLLGFSASFLTSFMLSLAGNLQSILNIKIP